MGSKGINGGFNQITDLGWFWTRPTGLQLVLPALDYRSVLMGKWMVCTISAQLIHAPMRPSSTGQLFNNRAACHLKLGNVRAVLKDAAAAFRTCDFSTLSNEPHTHTLFTVTSGTDGTLFKAAASMSKALEMAGVLGEGECGREDI